MASVHRECSVVSERGRDGMLGDGAKGEDGDCASRVWCGELEGTCWDARRLSTDEDGDCASRARCGDPEGT